MHRYNWKRYWIPEGQEITREGQGFWYVPEDQYKIFYSYSPVQLEDLANIPCLILLGQPGMGKTTALEQEAERLKEQSNELVQLVKLGEFSAQDLKEEIFQSSWFGEWKEGTKQLTLILDSFDEGQLVSRTLQNVIVRELKKVASDAIARLRLRISCRDTHWPKGFKDELVTLWSNAESGGEDSPDILSCYNLAPLRREDVECIAHEKNLNFELLIKQIFERKLVSFAEHPITLFAIIGQFEKSEKLSDSQIELYKSYSLSLCDENHLNPNKQRRYRLSSLKRMEVASNILAMIVCAGKQYFWTGALDDSGALDGINGSDCGLLLQRNNVQYEDLQEVLDTGLFFTRGNRVYPAQKTYAEFLTAYFLANHVGTTLEKINNHLAPMTQGWRTLVPTHLREIAGWLAGFNRSYQQSLTLKNSLILLDSNLEAATEKDKEAILDNYFQWVEDCAGDCHLIQRPIFESIQHGKLHQQLLGWLHGKHKQHVRSKVIDVVAYCEVKSLLPDLIKIACNFDEDLGLRIDAAHTISELGTKEERAQLLPLCLDMGDTVENQRLRGWVLYANWPDNMSASEVVSCLDAPWLNHTTIYSRFVEHDFVNRVRDGKEWLIVYDWFISAPLSQSFNPDPIIFKAVEFLECEDVVSSLFNIFESITEKGFYHRAADSLSEILSDKNKEIMLLEGLRREQESWTVREVVDGLFATRHEAFEVAWTLFQKEDESKKTILTFLLENYDEGQIEHTERLLNLLVMMPNNESLKERFDAWELDSDTSKTRKEYWYQYLNPKKEVVWDYRSFAERLASREQVSWVEWNSFFSRDIKTGKIANHQFFFDDESLAAKVNDLVARAIPNAAISFLQSNTHRLPLAKQLWVSELRALAAINWLVKFDLKALKQLSTDVVVEWLPTLLWQVSEPGEDRAKIIKQLCLMGSEERRIQVIQRFKEVLERPEYDWTYQRHNPFECFLEVWDKELTELLDQKLRVECNEKNIKGALAVYFKVAPNEATIFCSDLLEESVLSNCYTNASFWIWALIAQGEGYCFDNVINLILSDNDWYESFITTLNNKPLPLTKDIYSQLGENNCGRLYSRIKSYGKNSLAEVPLIGGGTHSLVEQFSSLLLNSLENAGTIDAVISLQTIQTEFPESWWLGSRVVNAMQKVCDTQWEYIPPSAFEQILDRNDSSFVQTNEQLAAIILRSLRRIEARLHGKNPIIHCLWNSNPKRTKEKEKWWPKYENECSDFIKNCLQDELQRQGVLLNREVEFRPVGRKGGERIDILAEAVSIGESKTHMKPLQVIIEVKCSYNSELKTSLYDQLYSRYLLNNDVSCGIYLVGWFSCSEWTNDKVFDSRKRETGSIDLLRNILEEQANAIDDEFRTVTPYVMDCRLLGGTEVGDC